MDTFARQVCIAAGSDIIMSNRAAEKILNISRESFAPAAADSVYQRVFRFSQLKRTDQTTDVLLAEFDFLWCNEVSKMRMGGASPGAFAPVSRMQKAELPRSEKSAVMASAQGSFGFVAMAKAMRRLSCPCGGAARRDVLVAADFEEKPGFKAHRKAPLEEEAGYKARAAHRKA